MAADPWFPFARPSADARLRLLCFAHAGAGASTFRLWRQGLPPEIDVLAAQLPGRETRLREAPRTRLDALLEELVPAVLPRLDRPYAIYGHSLGALVAFELARALRRRDAPLPRVLLVSGANAPHVPRRGRDAHALPEAELLADLRRLGGTPPEVLADRELMRLLVPILRADFALSETHAHGEEPPLDVPIVAIAGDRDPAVDDPGLAAWRGLGAPTSRVERLPGDHFTLLAEPSRLLAIVARELWERT